VPRLSIVIPCLGGAADFDGTLVSVLQNRPADCEVLVAHGEPYDDPYALGGEVRFLHAPRRSLVELINAAAEQSAGEIVHILACGLEVVEGWISAALPHFHDGDVAAVSPIVLGPDGKSVHAAGVRWSVGGARVVVRDQRVLAAGAGRRRMQILGPTLAAGFFRREVLLALGGFEPALGDELADIGLALDLEALGQISVCEPACQILRRSTVRAGQRPLNDGRAAERLFFRHANRRGLAVSLAGHPLAVFSELLRGRRTSLAAAAGRLLALGEVGAARRYRQRLAAAEAHLQNAAVLRVSQSQRARRSTAAPVTAAPARRAA
jgi:hypothetical protein